MVFKSDLGPFLALGGANFDQGVQKLDFSIFELFFTFFFVKHHHVGHFANPIWQMKGIFSAIYGDLFWKGSMPPNLWQFAVNQDQFLLIPAVFGVIFPKYLSFYFWFYSFFWRKITQSLTYFLLLHVNGVFWGSKSCFSSKKGIFWGENCMLGIWGALAQ